MNIIMNVLLFIVAAIAGFMITTLLSGIGVPWVAIGGIGLVLVIIGMIIERRLSDDSLDYVDHQVEYVRLNNEKMSALFRAWAAEENNDHLKMALLDIKHHDANTREGEKPAHERMRDIATEALERKKISYE